MIAAHAGDDLPEVMFAVVDELDLAMTGADGVTTAIMGTTIASTS